MSNFDYFGGVDFSGGREPLANLWSAVGVERDDRLHIVDLRPHAFREDLRHFLCHPPIDAERGLWGMDFPFSLPCAVSDALMNHEGPATWQAQVEWLAFQTPGDVETMAKPHRQTLRAIDPPGAMAALNLRLLKQTVAGARLLNELLHQEGAAVAPQMPIGTAKCVFIEVYPSATAKDLSLKGRKPNRPGQARARPEMLEPWLRFEHPSLAATAVTLEDAWDAVIACLTAWLVRDDLNQPTRVGKHEPAAVEREGWMYRHPEAV
ncbi:DUF429 domain-containing protein [Phycisphaerales bacterium AB-hyl4]|uniref:DUF429 domain-containing protein n=1 Tax=Natronomicrosphaera hydrolytica TaxID=3242702 RepID=A0ABV4U2E3_9BACT